MRTVVYPAVLDDAENGEKGYYTVEFPDVPGAISEGHGLADALYNAEQTLGLALYDVTNSELPKPTPLNEVIDFCKEKYPNAHVYPVATDLDAAAKEVKPAMVKKNTRYQGNQLNKLKQLGLISQKH